MIQAVEVLEVDGETMFIFGLGDVFDSKMDPRWVSLDDEAVGPDDGLAGVNNEFVVPGF